MNQVIAIPSFGFSTYSTGFRPGSALQARSGPGQGHYSFLQFVETVFNNSKLTPIEILSRTEISPWCWLDQAWQALTRNEKHIWAREELKKRVTAMPSFGFSMYLTGFRPGSALQARSGPDQGHYSFPQFVETVFNNSKLTPIEILSRTEISPWCWLGQVWQTLTRNERHIWAWEELMNQVIAMPSFGFSMYLTGFRPGSTFWTMSGPGQGQVRAIFARILLIGI